MYTIPFPLREYPLNRLQQLLEKLKQFYPKRIKSCHNIYLQLWLQCLNLLKKGISINNMVFTISKITLHSENSKIQNSVSQQKRYWLLVSDYSPPQREINNEPNWITSVIHHYLPEHPKRWGFTDIFNVLIYMYKELSEPYMDITHKLITK